MKLIKKIALPLVLGVTLASCGGGSAPILSVPIENIDTVPIKITELTEAQTKSWGGKDLLADTIPGMSVEKAYAEVVPKKKSGKVIVAVIDSGVDIEHEDLKNVIWTNKDEVPGNGIDDDKNGYVDDIHGWNFLGDMIGENFEYVRYIRKLGPKFEGKTMSSVAEADREDFAMYQKAMAEYEKEFAEISSYKQQYTQLLGQVKPAHEAMAAKLGKEDYTVADLQGIENPTATEQQMIAGLSQMLSFADSVPEIMKQLEDGIKYFDGQLNTNFNMEKEFRSAKLGDDPDDWNSKFYGNGDVDGPTEDKEDVSHGTHVAGIIAAQRGNGIGLDGVANNVEIMVIRAVPDGDEYDKDIALSIRYAVDNGAKVINTSFGKYYSPHPEWVWDAIKYAASKDVLIINAAGNEAFDLDTIQVYPNDQEGTGPEIADNFLTVGALNYDYGSQLVAEFSNYGKVNVDVFAPGVKIWSTMPLDEYDYQQGTSMAAPAVAGVAAMIRGYYPHLSAAQVKQVLMLSGLSSNTPVILGGDSSNQASFRDISKTGKMVNLYNAMIMASNMKTK